MTDAEPEPTGRLTEDGSTLELTRVLRGSVEDVWNSVTDSDRLSRWFGTWTGDPSAGHVWVKMNAEAETAPATRYDIVECRPPHVLSLDAVDDYGHWKLELQLAEHADGTLLVLRQREIDLGMVHDIGPGWEWYLDRLGAIVHGAVPPTLTDFEDRYRALGDHYRRIADPSL